MLTVKTDRAAPHEDDSRVSEQVPGPRDQAAESGRVSPGVTATPRPGGRQDQVSGRGEVSAVMEDQVGQQEQGEGVAGEARSSPSTRR
ncbi:hypothetical protein ACFQE3_21795 [Deinococcus aquaticus]